MAYQDKNDRWLGAPITVAGLTEPARQALRLQVARWQQARRQLCLSIVQGLPADVDAPAILAILPDRVLREEARRWALWLVSGERGLLTWYQQTVVAMPTEPSWRLEREFYQQVRPLMRPLIRPEGARAWRWHRRHGLDLTAWLGAWADGAELQVPARLRPLIADGIQPVLGQWLYWNETWVIHLFWPPCRTESRTLPRMAAALLVPPLVVPASSGYRVQRGDTLWGIANSQTGTGTNWHQLYTANRERISHPHWIYPGQVLVMPTNSQTPAPPPAAGDAIVVRPGDTLWRLAHDHSGHGSWWPQLWTANRDRLQRPDRLSVGLRLRWPSQWVLPMAMDTPGARTAPRRLDPMAPLTPSPETPAPTVALPVVVPPVRRTVPPAKPLPTTRRLPERSLQPSALVPSRALRVPTGNGPVLLSVPSLPAVPLRPLPDQAPATSSRPLRPTSDALLSTPTTRLDALTDALAPTSATPSDRAVLSTPVIQPAIVQPLQPEWPAASVAPPRPGILQPVQPLNRPVTPPSVLPPSDSPSGQPSAWPPPVSERPSTAGASDGGSTSGVIKAGASDAATVSQSVTGPQSSTPALASEAGALPTVALVDPWAAIETADVILPADVPVSPTTPESSEGPVSLPPIQVPVLTAVRPGDGGTDPWEGWLHPERPDPAHPELQAAIVMPQVAPAAIWPRVGWNGVPEYLTETAADQKPMSGWAMNRQRLSADWQWQSWLVRGRWTFGQYSLAEGDQRSNRQESWVDVDFGQRWSPMTGLQLGLLGRASWWSRRSGAGSVTDLRAADIQGFGLGPVGQMAIALGGGNSLMVEAGVQPMMGLTFSGPTQAAGQVGVVEGMIGWRANWGAWSPQVGYRGRWLYDADGRFGQVAHGLIGGVTIGWPGQNGPETP
ncbi:MAG: LysM peptidoglycan-binding domain-containing protein [Candidatus Sericytochromatia bacterium]|nr:LysM peptidoglycan-binding domain-containing protein [Candidatus Sericytochromatia bacterium]